MNNKSDVYWGDMLYDILKEANPEKAAEIKKQANTLGCGLYSYLLSAEQLYVSLLKEAEKGKVLGLLIKNRETLEKILSILGNEGVLLHLKAPGLDYKSNGNLGYTKK